MARWMGESSEVLDIECAAAVVDTFGVQEPARLWLLAASSERASEVGRCGPPVGTDLGLDSLRSAAQEAA